MILFEDVHSGKNNYVYCQTDENLRFAEHTHYGYEVIVVREGELICTLYKAPLRLTAGKAMLILPNQIHSYETPSHSKSFLCVFSPDNVEEFFRETENTFFESPIFDFDDMEKLDLLKRGASNKFLVKSILYYICGKAFSSSRVKGADSSAPDFTYKLLYYVQENYAEDISLKTLSEQLGYNYTYLSQLFRKTFHCGFPEFLSGYRLDRACTLLKTTKKTVAQICNECGFRTIRNFNAAFLKKFGMSPTAYRRRMNT